MLNNISEKFKIVLLQQCKISINNMQTPELWKKVIVRMIPKKNDGKTQREKESSCSHIGERARISLFHLINSF